MWNVGGEATETRHCRYHYEIMANILATRFVASNIYSTIYLPLSLTQCASKESGNGVQKDNITLENFWFVCRIIWNSSDCSTSLCSSLIRANAVEEMLNILSRKDFNPMVSDGNN